MEACGGSLYVEDAVVIDVPTQENCIWKVQTDKDHILVFSLADGGNFERIYDFTTVRITKIKCLCIFNRQHQNIFLIDSRWT